MRFSKLYMKLFSKCMLWAVAALVLSACQSDVVAPPKNESKGSLTVQGSIRVPDMPQIVTRGALGEKPANNLVLTVFEFDLGDTPAQSWLSNIYSEEVRLSDPTGVENGGVVNFQLTFKASTGAKVLHFFIADRALTSEHGSVATVLPNITSGMPGAESEAYWGSKYFENGLCDVDADGNVVLKEGVEDELQKIPMMRNFAKITVTDAADNFELLGFDIVNVPTSGTIAPWNITTQTIPDLLNGNAMKPYSDIVKDYTGITPLIAQFRNTEEQAKSWVDGANTNMRSLQARYMYEHPYESTRRTYLIVNGNFTNSDGTVTRGFYKLDIGKIDPATGTFDYYNIIRNINYNIRITSVLAPGVATVSEAITRAPFNNLIASTETSSMLNVSDGQNMLIVNDTNHIFVDGNQPVDVLYRYITDVTADNSPEANDIPHTVGLEPGTVIKEVGPKQTYTDPSGANWVKYTIYPNEPTDEVKTQDFSIVDNNGLGRTIHLVLRKPWQYAPITVNGTSYSATIATGNDDSYQGAPQVISTQAGQELTVYFNLPDGLPETMFPLEFQLESKNQGIENNKIGNLLVHTGASLFDSNKTAISYIKTVSYSEYKYNYIGDGSNNVDINSPNTKHTVRCRFLTITSTTDNNAEIMIFNPYFSPNASVKFVRQ